MLPRRTDVTDAVVGAPSGPGNALAFDLDGTVYLHEHPLPGAVELFEYLRGARVPYVFATNNSSATAARYVERLHAMGIAVEPDQVITSNHVAAAHLVATGASRAFIVATPEVRDEYAAGGVHHDPDTPEAVLLAFDTSLDYRKITTTSDFLLSGLPYYATHPDLVCPMPTGPIPDCGAFAALFQAATGRTPQVLGKPTAAMALTIRQRLEARSQRHAEVMFVGDRLYTDVRMANENGFTAVLTLTGEATASDLAGSEYRPDLVVHGLDDLLMRLSANAVR